MTDTPEDDWLSNPAPPPRSLDPAMTRPANVVPMRPLDQLARELDEAPIADGPEGDGGDPGFDPEDPGPDADRGASDPGPADPPAGDRRPSKWREGDRPRGEIWDGCPVRPLGINGKVQFFLDVHGQLQGETKLDIQTITRLFGNRHPLLQHRYPVYAKGAKKPTPGRFDATKAMGDMVAACADRGLFDPTGAVRGVGAWTDDDGNLIYHCGDRIYAGGETIEPSTIGGRIYPAQPAIPHPAAAVKGDGPVELIRAELGGWTWKRGEIDARIALGALGCLIMGGALQWRPAFWITGGAGTGKSRLNSLIGHLLGGEKGMVKSDDATAASIANRLRQSTLPVLLDELEPGDDRSTKERAIIELLRLASSGGSRTRSAADQSTSETILRSTFMASSILIPSLKPQDRSRILILDLQQFPPGTPAPKPLRTADWHPRGLALKRLLIDRWPSWAARLDGWRVALAECGVDSRNGDNLATVMAMAEMIEGAELAGDDTRKGWAHKLAAAVSVDLEEIGSDASDVLTWLLSQPFESFTRGEHYTVAQWIMVAGRLPGAPHGLMNDFGADDADQERRADAANAKLSKALIKVIRDRKSPDGGKLFVGTAKAAGLLKLFEGSSWAGGAWGQSLARVKGAVNGRAAGSRTLAGIATRGVEIPLKSIPGLMSFPQDRDVAPPAPPVAYMPEDFA